MNINYIDNIDLYEVDKKDYSSYEYRLREKQLMKITPGNNLIIFVDTKTKEWLLGYEETIVMSMPARKYYIFTILPEEQLASEKHYKNITMTQEDFNALIKLLVRDKNE